MEWTRTRQLLMAEISPKMFHSWEVMVEWDRGSRHRCKRTLVQQILWLGNQVWGLNNIVWRSKDGVLNQATSNETNRCICRKVGIEHGRHRKDIHRKHPTSGSKHHTLRYDHEKVAHKMMNAEWQIKMTNTDSDDYCKCQIKKTHCLQAYSNREARFTLGERYDASIFLELPIAPSMPYPACKPKPILMR